MTDRLARLADGHARRVLVIAAIFFVVAGAIGSGVADRLDPYGADDPSTESVKADDALRGRRLSRHFGGRPDQRRRRRRRRPGASASPGSPTRSRRIRTWPRSPALPRPAREPSSRATATRPISRSPCSRPTTMPPRTQPSGSPERSTASAGSTVGGSALAPEAGQRAGRAGPAPRRAARVPAALPALAAVLPQPRRGAAAAARRRPGDRRHVPDAARRQRARLDLDLRAQPRHRPRARAGDRLQPVRGLALSRGDRPPRPRVSSAMRRTMATAGPHGLVQLADRRRGARLADSSSRSASSTRWGSAARSSR